MNEKRGIPERKKRYGWLVGLTLCTWGLLLVMIFLIDPENVRDLVIKGSYIVFAVILFMALFLLLTIIFLSVKRAAWWSMGLLIFFYLRIFGFGSLVNGLLLLGVLICGELYARLGRE